MTEKLLKELAERYETSDFLPADPSWFMHQVKGENNQEITAFIASSLSYGSRKQFFPKIQFILDAAHNDVYGWVKSRNFDKDIPDTQQCYYRLYTCHTMNKFLHALADMIEQYGSIKDFIIKNDINDGINAVKAITEYFANKGIETIIPKNTSSACKRVCMFLRWMVRFDSPVDLGLWKGVIDRSTLIMPLDTHVIQEAVKLGLMSKASSSMSAAIKLTDKMRTIFPKDPLKGDFALFGYGVDEDK